MLKATEWVKYEAGSTIITEGEIEECFYIIVVGEVIVKKREKSLAVLKTGDCFGEMAYLGKTTRTATIEALKNTILMKINASIIDQTSISTQLRFYKVFFNTLIQRLVHTSELLSKLSFDEHAQ
jgi:CRP-like cAMP-binding protein